MRSCTVNCLRLFLCVLEVIWGTVKKKACEIAPGEIIDSQNTDFFFFNFKCALLNLNALNGASNL